MKINNVKNATPDEIRAIQRKALEILLYFKGFCETHNLLFFFCGGCCIGTIRHRGFIPWDDDIDVFMPRDDYEKLAVLWEQYGNKEEYSYCRTNQKENYHNIGASIRDNNTTFINRHSKNEDIHHGLMIDIIPLDGYPKSKLSRFKQVFFAMLYSLFNAQRLPDNQGKFIRIMARIIFGIVSSKKLRYKIWRFSEKQMTKHKISDCEYITELASGFKYMKNKYPKELFSQAILKKFEEYSLPIPIGYDLYLKMAFGDYMKLPPKEQQIAKHNTVYINLSESYKKFKGIYFCAKKES